MSEKIVLTDKDYAIIKDLSPYCTQKTIADNLSTPISERCFRDILNRDAKALAAYQRGRGEGAKIVGSKLYQKAMAGETTEMLFYLKTQCGWKVE